MFLIFSQSIEHNTPKSILELLKTKHSGNNLDSPINSAERRFTEKMVKEIRNLEKYLVSLCQDVILEVLSFGNRRRLAKLEREFTKNTKNFLRNKTFRRKKLSMLATWVKLAGHKFVTKITKFDFIIGGASEKMKF